MYTKMPIAFEICELEKVGQCHRVGLQLSQRRYLIANIKIVSFYIFIFINIYIYILLFAK